MEVAAEHVAQEASQPTHVDPTSKVLVGHVTTHVLSWFKNSASGQTEH